MLSPKPRWSNASAMKPRSASFPGVEPGRLLLHARIGRSDDDGGKAHAGLVVRGDVEIGCDGLAFTLEGHRVHTGHDRRRAGCGQLLGSWKPRGAGRRPRLQARRSVQALESRTETGGPRSSVHRKAQAETSEHPLQVRLVTNLAAGRDERMCVLPGRNAEPVAALRRGGIDVRRWDLGRRAIRPRLPTCPRPGTSPTASCG